jgi:hypothetical protein
MEQVADIEKKVMEFNNQAVTLTGFEAIMDPATTRLVFKQCTSSEWEQIGEMLIQLPRLESLELYVCMSPELICHSLESCQSLRNLAMSMLHHNPGMCNLTSKGV